MTSRPSRRAFLSGAAVGLVALTAGCGSSGTQPTTDPTADSTAEPTPTSTTGARTAEPTPAPLSVGEQASASGETVTVTGAQVRKIVYTPDVGSSAHMYPAGSVDSQFVVVSVTSSETPVPDLSLSLVVDGDATTDRPYRLGFSPGRDGRLAFPVPVGRADAVGVRWTPASDEQYQWSLPGSVTDAVSRSPAFTVDRFDVPEQFDAGERFTADLSVSNGGDRDGRFLGVVLNQGAGSVPLVPKFAMPVPAGGSESRQVRGGMELEPFSAGSESEMTARLDWGGEERRETFQVTS